MVAMHVGDHSQRESKDRWCHVTCSKALALFTRSGWLTTELLKFHSLLNVWNLHYLSMYVRVSVPRIDQSLLDLNLLHIAQKAHIHASVAPEGPAGPGISHKSSHPQMPLGTTAHWRAAAPPHSVARTHPTRTVCERYVGRQLPSTHSLHACKSDGLCIKQRALFVRGALHCVDSYRGARTQCS
jgi:hypothetical protein